MSMTVLPEATWYVGQESIASKICPTPFDSVVALSLYSSSDTSGPTRIASDANWTHIAPRWPGGHGEAADQRIETPPHSC